MTRTGRRLFSFALVAVGVLLAASAMRQGLASDDGGPPLGAVCMVLPSAVLFIAAGKVWPSKDRLS